MARVYLLKLPSDEYHMILLMVYHITSLGRNQDGNYYPHPLPQTTSLCQGYNNKQWLIMVHGNLHIYHVLMIWLQSN